MLNVCLIGGGHGMSSTIKALKKLNVSIKAIVGVSDDGGSSGILREKFNILPPGDIRMVLSALSTIDKNILDVFNYRFPLMNNHPLGNFLISSVINDCDDLTKAFNYLMQVFKCQGEIIPLSYYPLVLRYFYHDSQIGFGESKAMAHMHNGINYIKVSDKKINPRTLTAILEADFVIYCPGSFYSSLICNLTNIEVINALKNTKAKKIYLANIFSEPHETYNLNLNDHINLLKKYVGADNLDLIIANNAIISADLITKYHKMGKKLLGDFLDEENKKITVFSDLLFINNKSVYHSISKRRLILKKILFEKW